MKGERLGYRSARNEQELLTIMLLNEFTGSVSGILFLKICCNYKFIVFMFSKQKRKLKSILPLKFKDTKIKRIKQLQNWT
jgi:hypothetical protein